MAVKHVQSHSCLLQKCTLDLCSTSVGMPDRQCNKASRVSEPGFTLFYCVGRLSLSSNLLNRTLNYKSVLCSRQPTCNPCLCTGASRNPAYLSNVCVAEAAQRRSVGRCLLNEARRVARGWGECSFASPRCSYFRRFLSPISTLCNEGCRLDGCA